MESSGFEMQQQHRRESALRITNGSISMGDIPYKKNGSIVVNPYTKSGTTIDNPYKTTGTIGASIDPYKKSGTIAVESRKYSVLVDPTKFKFSESESKFSLSEVENEA